MFYEKKAHLVMSLLSNVNTEEHKYLILKAPSALTKNLTKQISFLIPLKLN